MTHNLMHHSEVYEADLQGELRSTANSIAVVGSAYADAHREAQLAAMQVDRLEAALSLEYRAEADATGKKTTEGAVEAKIRTDPRWEAMRLAQIDADADRERLSALLAAVKAKKDLVCQLAMIQRAEMAAS